MPSPAPVGAAPPAARDHAYHRLRIAEVIRETADACTLVLDVPGDLAEAFRYEPGQFCTFRASLGGEAVVRCYSMSSAPAVDPALAVTVKRVPSGVMSNWINDSLAAGDEIDAAPPAGFFQLHGTGPVVAFAGGSGIAPIFSLLKTVLVATDRRIRLLYANRDRASIIFDRALASLMAAYPNRLTVVHHLDVDDGLVTSAVAGGFLGDAGGEVYICGPGPFMEIVEQAALAGGVGADAIHIERFTPVVVDDAGAPPDVEEITVTVEIGRRSGTTAHRAGSTILQVARQLGLSPPSSCESGSCATCMARLLEGTVTMRVNNALTPEEVEEGWVLTCQSVPTSPTVRVVYEES